MNSKQVIEKLNEKLNLDEATLAKFTEIVKEVPVVGKTNKEKMVKQFIEKLGVDESTAEHYYETFSEVIMTGIKDKLKHPFK